MSWLFLILSLWPLVSVYIFKADAKALFSILITFKISKSQKGCLKDLKGTNVGYLQEEKEVYLQVMYLIFSVILKQRRFIRY